MPDKLITQTELEVILAPLAMELLALKTELHDKEDQFLELMPHITPGIVEQAAETTYPRPFDLADLTADSFSVMSNGAVTTTKIDAAAVWIAGKLMEAIAVDGMTWDGGDFTDPPLYPRWTSGTIDADQYVWLELNRQDNEVTIFMGTTLPNGSDAKYDYTEIHPLWFIPWDSTAGSIDAANIVDYRGAIRLPAMA